MFVLATAVIIEIYTYRRQYYELEHSNVELICGGYIMVYAVTSWVWRIGSEGMHIMNFFLLLFMLMRCKSCTLVMT